MSIPSVTVSGMTTVNISSTEGIGTQDFTNWVGAGIVDITQSAGTANVTVGKQTSLTLNDQSGSGTVATTGGASVNVTAPGHAVSVNSGGATSQVSVTNSGTVQITDSHHGTGTPNTISTVSLDNCGATTIESDALTTLNLNAQTANVTVDALAESRSLTLNLNWTGTISITDATATSVDVEYGIGNTSPVQMHLASATSITLDVGINFGYSGLQSGTPLIDAPEVTTFTIEGGNFSDNLQGLNPAAKIIADTVDGYVTVEVGPGQSFQGGEASDTVIIHATPTAPLIGGEANTGTLVLDGMGTINSTTLGETSNFSTLRFTGNTSGGINMASLSATNIDVASNGSAGVLEFDNAANNTSVILEQGYTGTFTILPSQSGSAVSIELNDSSASDTIQSVSELDLQNGGAGYNALYLDNRGSTPGIINVLQDAALANVDFSGFQSCTVTTFAPQVATLTIDENSYSGNDTITNLTDNSLTALVFTGQIEPTSSSMIVASLDSTSTTLTITDSCVTEGAIGIQSLVDASLATATFSNSVGTNPNYTPIPFSINAAALPALASLTLRGSVAISIGGDLVTSGITISGGTDNANINFESTGATASGAVDSVTLGNGNDTVALGAGVAGSTHGIALGTGADTVNDSTRGTLSVSIVGAPGVSENINAYTASSVSITCGAGNNSIDLAATGITGTINVGAGSNVIILSGSTAVGITVASHATSTEDSIIIGTSGTSLTNIVQIAGLNNSGNDILNFQGAGAATLSGFTQIEATDVTNSGGNTAALADWVAAADGKTGRSAAGGPNTVTWFQFGDKTY